MMHIMTRVVHIGHIDASETPPPEGGDEDLLSVSTPEFRAVPTPDGRKGVRLERAFWQALAGLAERAGVKRSKVISDVLHEATDLGLNSTSALRSYAIRQLDQELQAAQEKTALAFAVPMMQQAPVPSFAVGLDKRLIRVNGEFNHFLRILFAEMGEAVRSGLQINLERPVAQLFEELGSSGQSCECMMNVVMGSRVRRVRTRLVAVPPHDPTALVGYIVP